jgi:hypothetical protein
LKMKLMDYSQLSITHYQPIVLTFQNSDSLSKFLLLII